MAAFRLVVVRARKTGALTRCPAQAKRDASDVYSLLAHAIKRRDNCGGFALIDAKNCKCYLSARDPNRKK